MFCHSERNEESLLSLAVATLSTVMIKILHCVQNDRKRNFVDETRLGLMNLKQKKCLVSHQTLHHHDQEKLIKPHTF